MIPTIPEFEVEVVQAGARAQGGEITAVPTTKLKFVHWRGIRLTSRYRKADEFRLMLQVVEALPQEVRRAVLSIDCDSKVGSMFRVETLFWIESMTRALSMSLREILLSVNRGHNGVTIAMGKLSFVVEPEWRVDPGSASVGECPF